MKKKVAKNIKKPDFDRGRVKTIVLNRSILFNGNPVTKVEIEIDHINYGLDPKTKKLSKKKRTNFTIKDIEKFIMQLDEEDIVASQYVGKNSIFSVKINCPVKGTFEDKLFIMILSTHYDKVNELHTITMYPGW